MTEFEPLNSNRFRCSLSGSREPRDVYLLSIRPRISFSVLEGPRRRIKARIKSKGIHPLVKVVLRSMSSPRSTRDPTPTSKPHLRQLCVRFLYATGGFHTLVIRVFTRFHHVFILWILHASQPLGEVCFPYWYQRFVRGVGDERYRNFS